MYRVAASEKLLIVLLALLLGLAPLQGVPTGLLVAADHGIMSRQGIDAVTATSASLYRRPRV